MARRLPGGRGSRVRAIALLAALGVAAGCDGEPSPGRLVPEPPPLPDTAGRSGALLPPQLGGRTPSSRDPVPLAPGTRARFAPGAGGRRGDTLAGADFADWVVGSDPLRQYLLEAVVRGDARLEVLVNPYVTGAQVHRALRGLLDALRQAFPGRPLAVIGVSPSGEELARLEWDPRTGATATTWR